MEPQPNQPANQQPNQAPDPAGMPPQNQWPSQQSAPAAQQPSAPAWQPQSAPPAPGVVIGGVAPQAPDMQPAAGFQQPVMVPQAPKKKPVLLITIIAIIVLIGGAAAYVILSGRLSNHSATNTNTNTGNNTPKGATTVELSSLQGVTFVPGDMGGLSKVSTNSQSGLTSYESTDKNCKLAYGVLAENSSYLGATPAAIAQTLATGLKSYGTVTDPTKTDDLVLADSSSNPKQYKLTTYTFDSTISGKQIAYYISGAVFADGNRAIVSVACGTNNSAAKTTVQDVRNIAKNFKVTPKQ